MTTDTASFCRVLPRPSLPPLLGCALGVWISSASVLVLAEKWSSNFCFMVGIGGAALSLAFMFVFIRGKFAQVCAIVLGVLVGLSCAGWYAFSQHETLNRLSGASGEFCFEALSDAQEGQYGSSCRAKVISSEGKSIVVRILFPEEITPIFNGMRFVSSTTLDVVSESAASYCWQQGVIFDAHVREVSLLERQGVTGVVLSLRTSVIELFSEQGSRGAGLLAALVCGWRGSLDDELYNSFKAVGLAHVVAVSGAHLSIVSSFISMVLRFCRIPRGVSLSVQAFFLLGYLVFSGVFPSAVRAVVMAFIAMGSAVDFRRSASINALALCIVGCISLVPQTALSVSFTLSTLSTLGIVLFARLMSFWFAAVLPSKTPSFIKEALALTLSSSVFATPIASSLFSQVSLVSLLSNLLATPLFSPLCIAGIFAGFIGLMAPQIFLTKVVCLGAEGFAFLVDILAEIPYASIPIPLPFGWAVLFSALLAAVLWVIWPQRGRLVMSGIAVISAVGVLMALLVLPRLSGDEIVMLDVGQGDAFLIRSHGSTMLIDTGNQDTLLREALARQGVTRLDAVLLTHGDDDHMGSLASLKQVVEIDRVLLASNALLCTCDSCAKLTSTAEEIVGKSNLKGLVAGDVVSLGVFSFEVVWPYSFVEEGGNADSLCLLGLVDVDKDGVVDWKTLFTGDLEKEQIKQLIDDQAVGKVDIYKVGHHGSKNALTNQEAHVLSPSIALISVGERNRYGHPSVQIIDLLELAGATVFRTDESGDVSCKLKANQIEVDTLR